MPTEPPAAAAPGLEHVTDLHVTLAEPQRLGERSDGVHWFIPILGGQVDGPLLSGRVLPGGGDWAIERPDGVWELDARYGLVLDDGTPVEVHNRGFYAETTGRVAYYQTTPLFRVAGTGDGRTSHGWLSRTVFVGQAHEVDPLHIRIEVFAVRDPRS